jgi:hypothetical protein
MASGGFPFSARLAELLHVHRRVEPLRLRLLLRDELRVELPVETRSIRASTIVGITLTESTTIANFPGATSGLRGR